VPDQQYRVIIRTRTAGSTAGSISVTSGSSTIYPNCAPVPQSSTTVHCWSVDSFRAGSTLTLSRMSCGDVFAGNRLSFPQFVGNVKSRKVELLMKLHNKDNLIQNITLCNIFSKKVYAVYNGVWGKTPEAGKFSRIFVLKVTLQVTFNCKFQKKLGEH